MVNRRFVDTRFLCIILALFASTLAYSSNNDEILYEGDDFTFSAPANCKTSVHEPPYFDPTTNSELLLFSNIGHYPYFSINRQNIPPGSDLDTVFTDYMLMITKRFSYAYQFISQNTISMINRTAIEYVHREYIGEPYVQTREIWMEYNGWAYSLACVSPATATPDATIPISEQYIRLAEGFQFK